MRDNGHPAVLNRGVTLHKFKQYANNSIDHTGFQRNCI